MATPTQIEANRINAQRSTGPRTPEGKAAVAQNRTSHGLAGAFSILPCEDIDAYRRLFAEYLIEYHPETPTERFFVTELVQAQWRLMRADAIEAELLNPGENPTYAAVAAAFREDDAIIRLGRYAQAARRAYYKAHDKLQSLRRTAARETDEEEREFERQMDEYIDAPPPTAGRPVRIPVPPKLQREINALIQRNPDFDPERDASQMSTQLRHWYENFRKMAA